MAHLQAAIGEDVDVESGKAVVLNRNIGYEDMTQMEDMDLESLMENCRLRYSQDQMYTYVGTILVAINPFKRLPIYGPEWLRLYPHARVGAQPPHVYAIAEATYAAMSQTGKDQSVLISGESGAGKTESTKLILRYLTRRSNLDTNRKSDKSVEKKILESVPILEALGNAKTLRNDNSSRFGKFIEVQFNRDNHIVGSKIIPYLLEKSRVVHQLPGERNFHIFYQLTEGATPDMRDRYKLRRALDYEYLNKSGCITLSWSDYNEAAALKGFEDALALFNISEKARTSMYTTLSAILHLGNVGWADHATQSGVVELADERSVEALGIAAELLGFTAERLQYWLSHQRVVIMGEAIWKNLTAQQARYLTDSFAKAIYSKLFDWLVYKLNAAMHAEAAGQKTKNTIGVLDIFGFEKFVNNSFEQFLINYCNEQLQKFFNHYIFALEQAEYEREGIDWSQIDFVDNQATLDLIDLHRPTGILALLDDQCRQPKSTDDGFITALNKLFGEGERASPLYSKPRLKRTHFALNHYAGLVEYDITNWLDKNKDELPVHLTDAMKDETTSTFASLLFSDIEADLDDNNNNNNNNSNNNKKSSASSSQAASSQQQQQQQQGQQGQRVTRTTGAYFKQQLKSLMDNLAQTQPHFVRTVKPNLQAKPDFFDDEEIKAQLLYAGMLETIRIRRIGFPVRFSYSDFLWKYHVIRPSFTRVPESPQDTCRNLLISLAITPQNAQVGSNKVFLKQDTANALEGLRGLALTGAVLRLQTWWRMASLRRLFLVRKFACSRIQATWRAHNQYKRYQRMKAACLTIQLAVRRHQARLLYLRLKHDHELYLEHLSKMEKSEREAKLAADREAEAHKIALLLAEQKAIKAQQQQQQQQQDALSSSHGAQANEAASSSASVIVAEGSSSQLAALSEQSFGDENDEPGQDGQQQQRHRRGKRQQQRQGTDAIVLNSKVTIYAGFTGSYSHATASMLMFRFHKLRDHTNELNDFSRDNAIEHLGHTHSLVSPDELASAVGSQQSFSGEMFNANFASVSSKTTTIALVINVTSKDTEPTDRGKLVVSVIDHKTKEVITAQFRSVEAQQDGNQAALLCTFVREGTTRWVLNPVFRAISGRNYKLSLPAITESLPPVPRVRAFDITVESALGLALVHDEAPDTYAICNLDVRSMQTPVAKKSVSPGWKHYGRLVGQANALEVRIFAKVGWGADVYLGSGLVKFTDQDLVMMKEQWVKLDRKGQVNITVLETRPDAPLPEGVSVEPARKPTLTRRLSHSRLSRMSITLPKTDRGDGSASSSASASIPQLLNIAAMSIQTGVQATPRDTAEAHARELKKVKQNTVVQRFTFEGLPHHVKTIPLHIDMTATDVLAEVALRIELTVESLELCERLADGRLELVETTSTPVALDQADLQTPRGSQIKTARQLLKLTSAGRVVLSTRDMVVCPKGWCALQPTLSPSGSTTKRISKSSKKSSSSSKSSKTSSKKRSFFGAKK